MGGEVDFTTSNVFFQTSTEEESTAPKISGEPPTGNERILFIDDEELLANLGKRTLTRLGYKATIKTNSKEALELFRSQPEDFDLVITDQTMPDLNGAELSKELLKIRPDIPIILCTGHSSKVSEDDISELGIRKFMLKPMDKIRLATTIRKVLDGE